MSVIGVSAKVQVTAGADEVAEHKRVLVWTCKLVGDQGKGWVTFVLEEVAHARAAGED